MNINESYPRLIESVLNGGRFSAARNSGTTHLTGTSIIHDLQDGFPILESRHISFKSALAEFYCWWHGITDTQILKSLGCTYWKDNVEAEYWQEHLRKAEMSATLLGPVYGSQWRNTEYLNAKGEVVIIDQLVEVIRQLQFEPSSRRIILSCWNPGQLSDMCLPPCYPLIQFIWHGQRLDMVVTQRSLDLILGLPYDLVLFGLIQHTVSKLAVITPGRLIINVGDAHIYNSHLEYAKKLINSTKQFLITPPKLKVLERLNHIDQVNMSEYTLKGYPANLPREKLELIV